MLANSITCSYIPNEGMIEEPDAFAKATRSVSDFNRVAQIAADKGCIKIARKLWLFVVDNYVGSRYAAYRQRAQIGIDDIRYRDE